MKPANTLVDRTVQYKNPSGYSESFVILNENSKMSFGYSYEAYYISTKKKNPLILSFSIVEKLLTVGHFEENGFSYNLV